MSEQPPNDELTPLVDAVATGRAVDWKTETKELDVQQMRTATGLQEIEAIARAHRALLHDAGEGPSGGAASDDSTSGNASSDPA